MKRSVLLLPLLLTACTASSGGAPAAVQAVPTPTAVVESPTATRAPGPSPSPSAAQLTSAVRALDGDVDGDGKPDSVRVSGTTLTVTLSGTRQVLTAQVDRGLDGSEPAATAGSVDIDRDGHAEVFVRVAQGASTETLRAFRYNGRALAPVDAAGAPLLLVVGGSVTHGDGFSCTERGRLVVRSAQSDDGTAFTVTTTTYRLAGGAAVRIAGTVVHASGMNQPAVAAAYRVDCGSVGEGD